MTPDPAPSFYQTHPLTCAREDHWGQVRRTVNGQPIARRQIELILESVAKALDLQATDRLLDLCCGNGALTTHWFARCRGGLGVDHSEPLIQIARESFCRGAHEQYRLASVLDFAAQPQAAGMEAHFDKAICYGSMQYFERAAVAGWLADLRRNIRGLQRFLIGNLPDRERLAAFRKPGVEVPLNDPHSAIGCWWSATELGEIAHAAGFDCEVLLPNPEFFAAHYRFDALLRPRAS